MRSKGLSFLKTLVKIGSGILLFLVILVFLFFFFFSGWEGLLMGTDQELKRELGVDISGYTEITESDNHGGFHGDGELLYTAYYNAGPAAELEEKLEVLAGKETSGWKKLPMTEVLQTAAYGIKEETRRVGPYVTLDGQPLIEMPFGEVHTLSVVQPDGAENVVKFTGDAVYMERANCENQDCVQMGAVTEDNLEMRVMGGFIVCLPHRVSVEVRGG